MTHSVANELSVIPDEVPGTRRFLESAAKLVKRPRPDGAALGGHLLGYPGYPPQKTYRPYQLLGINNYFGWYRGRPRHSTAKLSGLAPYLSNMRANYPDKALVMTEFGAEATFDGPANVKETYAFQSNYIRRTLQIVKREAFVSGAIYWTLKEFAVKPAWDGGAKRAGVPRDSIHNKGLITYDGRLKPASGKPPCARSRRRRSTGLVCLPRSRRGRRRRSGPPPSERPRSARPHPYGVKRTVITSPSRIS